MSTQQPVMILLLMHSLVHSCFLAVGGSQRNLFTFIFSRGRSFCGTADKLLDPKSSRSSFATEASINIFQPAVQRTIKEKSSSQSQTSTFIFIVRGMMMKLQS